MTENHLSPIVIELLVLKKLSLENSCGYKLFKYVESVFQNNRVLFEWTACRFYFLLFAMEKNQYIIRSSVRHPDKRSRSYFRITETGSVFLDCMKDEIKRVMPIINSCVELKDI